MSKREDLEALVWVDGMAERHGGELALAFAAEVGLVGPAGRGAKLMDAALVRAFSEAPRGLVVK
jgi:hypothetical protein